MESEGEVRCGGRRVTGTEAGERVSGRAESEEMERETEGG